MHFMMKHIDRKSHEVIFRKCANPRCNHCVSNPVVSVKAWKYLKDREFKWPNPVDSVEYPRHYQTFLEVDKLDKDYIKTGML